MAELKKDMKRLDVDFFTEDDDPVMEQEQNIENVPAENIGNAEVLTTEESLEEPVSYTHLDVYKRQVMSYSL